MHLARILNFLLLPIAACLQWTKTDTQGTIQCNDDIDIEKRWGVYIDGRSAASGRLAYGQNYSQTMESALSTVLHKASLPSAREGLTLEFFEFVQNLLHAEWRSLGSPLFSEVGGCFDKLRHIFANGTVTPFLVKLAHHPANADKFKATLSSLFSRYNEKIAVAKPDDALTVIATLLRHLAWLHPLADKNGRLRLLLLQYELRRNNIACGTMMYNNNKNIYFDSLDMYVAKIQEGINMYNVAQENDFVDNPWLQPGVAKTRLRFFDDSEADVLEVCWDQEAAGVSRGANGTSILLLKTLGKI
eukprot:gnl/TRDRNA2_/TRDRNA2_172021_c1_seq3.p1 gnl/TRDRNA2_/TRDRNA2_172021_c1~~gnl/TRDRNA2_/TRDRNA2_172021_c1_seq3.p1  ORF type:complete len:302 (-),score=31.76 gnl/TRDRNA2_/TRDRNA2_172021_c1_seq3:49-954(-)